MEQAFSLYLVTTKHIKQIAKSKYTYLIIVIVTLVLLYSFNPSNYWFWPKCPFKLITTLSCPACGIQRFLHALTNGEIQQAYHYNYYLIYALPYTFAVIVTYYLPNGKWKEKMTSIFEGKIAVWIYVCSFCIWFVLRNVLKI